MNYTHNEVEFLIQELKIELNGHLDGAEKNLIAEYCPYCHKKHKFAIYIGKPTAKKTLFASHCFSCGKSNRELTPLLEYIGRTDLVFEATNSISAELDNLSFITNENGDIVDDSVDIIDPPKGFKRSYKNNYLRNRGFNADDYGYFPVGTTRGCNFKLDNYVIFLIIDAGDIVGWVARHIWPKQEIDEHNRKVKRNDGYQIMRYRNSTENDFVKLLYNFDAVIEGETDTVIIVEGIFDVIALTRKLELYDCQWIAVVATFGKKISNVQIYKLQTKRVRTVVLAYDGDAVEANRNTAQQLKPYFDTYIADIDGSLDFDEMDRDQIYDTFAYRIKTPIEYSLNKI